MSHPTIPDQKTMDVLADPFYSAIGKATARWQFIEAALFILGHAILKTEFRFSSLVLYQIKSADMKLQLVDRLCREKFSKSIVKSQWDPLHRQLFNALRFRNQLAHFEANFVANPSHLAPGEPPLALTPHVLDYKAHKNSDAVTAATTNEILAVAETFRLLSRVTIQFVQHNFSLQERRALNLPPELQRYLESTPSAPPRPRKPQKSSRG